MSAAPAGGHHQTQGKGTRGSPPPWVPPPDGVHLPRRRSSSAGPRTPARSSPSSGGRQGPWTSARTGRRPRPGGGRGRASRWPLHPRVTGHTPPPPDPACARALGHAPPPARCLLTSAAQAARPSGKTRRRQRTRLHTAPFTDMGPLPGTPRATTLGPASSGLQQHDWSALQAITFPALSNWPGLSPSPCLPLRAPVPRPPQAFPRRLVSQSPATSSWPCLSLVWDFGLVRKQIVY